MSKPERLEYLFKRYYREELTPEEGLELSALVKAMGDEDLSLVMKKTWEETVAPVVFFSPGESERMLSGILQKRAAPVRHMAWIRVAAAAVIIFMVIGAYFLFHKGAEVKPVAGKEIKTDVLPGHDGAVLTLADGRKILLDDAKDGKITEVAVKNGSRVSYENNKDTKVEFNTMTTPKGRQFSLVLPDGSQVWLNAASSITYPTAFVGNDRKVSITGEVYFEVTHDATRPFHVDVNGMDVQVLGTHFNINSYSDEQIIKTTLLEGAVKVTSGVNVALLSPGQQSALSNNGSLIINKDINIREITAWKDGYFYFKNADLKTILRQFARWYDVEVIYEGAIQPRKFLTVVSRNSTLKTVLELLQDNDIQYRIEDKKLIVKSG